MQSPCKHSNNWLNNWVSLFFFNEIKRKKVKFCRKAGNNKVAWFYKTCDGLGGKKDQCVLVRECGESANATMEAERRWQVMDERWNWRIVLGLEGSFNFTIDRQGVGGKARSPAMPLFSIYRMTHSFEANCLIWWGKSRRKIVHRCWFCFVCEACCS